MNNFPCSNPNQMAKLSLKDNIHKYFLSQSPLRNKQYTGSLFIKELTIFFSNIKQTLEEFRFGMEFPAIM